jgi:uncharacterized protein
MAGEPMLEVMSNVTGDLLERGWARRRNALSRDECVRLRNLYTQDSLFRSRIVMERHSYGSGEYKYFAYPLPERVAGLRASLYNQLMPVANRWNELLRLEQRYPSSLQDYLAQCHKAGQTRPTPLMLRYRAGDYNCLHQDTYGALAFPFQATLFLSDRAEYDGGEFVLVEQRPRAQSKPIVITPEQGDCIIIPNRYRPVPGKRGIHRTAFRHGVSEIRRGERYALGLIFHDAI